MNMLVTMLVWYGRHLMVTRCVVCIRDECALGQRVKDVGVVLTHGHGEGWYAVW